MHNEKITANTDGFVKELELYGRAKDLMWTLGNVLLMSYILNSALELLHTRKEYINGTTALKKCLAVLTKLNTYQTYDLVIPMHVYPPKIKANVNINTKASTYMFIIALLVMDP